MNAVHTFLKQHELPKEFSVGALAALHPLSSARPLERFEVNFAVQVYSVLGCEDFHSLEPLLFRTGLDILHRLVPHYWDGGLVFFTQLLDIVHEQSAPAGRIVNATRGWLPLKKDSSNILTGARLQEILAEFRTRLEAWDPNGNEEEKRKRLKTPAAQQTSNSTDEQYDCASAAYTPPSASHFSSSPAQSCSRNGTAAREPLAPFHSISKRTRSPSLALSASAHTTAAVHPLARSPNGKVTTAAVLTAVSIPSSNRNRNSNSNTRSGRILLMSSSLTHEPTSSHWSQRRPHVQAQPKTPSHSANSFRDTGNTTAVASQVRKRRREATPVAEAAITSDSESSESECVGKSASIASSVVIGPHRGMDEHIFTSCKDGFAGLMQRYPLLLKPAPRTDALTAEMYLRGEHSHSGAVHARAYAADETSVPCALIIHGLPAPSHSSHENMRTELVSVVVKPNEPKQVLVNQTFPDGSVELKVSHRHCTYSNAVLWFNFPCTVA
jgi:hypothetical protein